MAAPIDDLTILMHLQQQASERFHTRRQLEWQFAFSFWVLLGGLGVALRGVSHPQDKVFALVLGLVALFFHVRFQQVYVYPHMKSDWIVGLEIEPVLRAALDDHLHGEIPSLKVEPRPRGYQWFWSHGWQVVITAAIGLVVVLTT